MSRTSLTMSPAAEFECVNGAQTNSHNELCANDSFEKQSASELFGCEPFRSEAIRRHFRRRIRKNSASRCELVTGERQVETDRGIGFQPVSAEEKDRLGHRIPKGFQRIASGQRSATTGPRVPRSRPIPEGLQLFVARGLRWNPSGDTAGWPGLEALRKARKGGLVKRA